jgi:hypothetical protein
MPFRDPSPAVATSRGRSAPTMRTSYQTAPASADRSKPCSNRNGIWPPRYQRNWAPHPHRSLANTAQAEWQRCVHDAVAAGELHRTTGAVLLAFCRASDNRLDDVWVAQSTIGERLQLATSTVCHHVTIAKRAGWLAVQHRNRVDHGIPVAMTNLTRFELPQHWRDQLDQQRRERDARRAATRRSSSARHGRTSEPPQQQAVRATPETHAASAGAATARSASTTDFDAGRRELEQSYAGQPHLFEAAFDAFVSTWNTVRRNE